MPRDPEGGRFRSALPSSTRRLSDPSSIDRRIFLASTAAALFVSPTGSAAAAARIHRPGAHDDFPRQDPRQVYETVVVAHGDFERLRELVEASPALSKSAIDWGFGDWESALGAASHMGEVDMAEFLIRHGARPNLFSAAMLDQVDVVRAQVDAGSGLQRLRGPHSISLLAHARAPARRIGSSTIWRPSATRICPTRLSRWHKRKSRPISVPMLMRAKSVSRCPREAGGSGYSDRVTSSGVVSRGSSSTGFSQTGPRPSEFASASRTAARPG